MESCVVVRPTTGEPISGKLGLRIALAIEEDLLRNGWRHERLVGSQAAIQRRFGIGRWAFREAAKLLEVRGSARMKRGPGGGLCALAPDLGTFARQVSAYLHLTRGGDERMVQGALAALRTLPGGTLAENLIVNFLLRLLERVLATWTANDTSDNSTASVMPTGTCGSLNELNYAQQLASRIIDEAMQARDAAPQSIGSEWEIAARYGYSLEVVRQASRILEGMELVEVRTGRQGGIFLRKPRLVLSHAQLRSYFAACGAEPSQIPAAIATLRILLEQDCAVRDNPLLASLITVVQDAQFNVSSDGSTYIGGDVRHAHC